MEGNAVDVDDIDVFGMLSGANPPAVFTFPQYVALVTAMAARMGFEKAFGAHLFNVDEHVCGIVAEVDEVHGDDDDVNSNSSSSPIEESKEESIGETLDSVVNPLLCAHLARESVAAMLRDPQGIPTVLCRTPAEKASLTDPSDPTCHHGAPHVHCLCCFHRVVEEDGPRGPTQPDLVAHAPTVTELKHTWVEHYHRHRQHSKKLLSMLDGTRVAYVGESDDEFDLDTEDGVAECEVVAAEESRHCCFLVSAGTAACPLLAAYCAECNQFAPFTRFLWEGDAVAEALDDGDNKQPRRCAPGWEAWVSKEEGLTVVARLLLACHLYVQGAQQRAQLARLHAPLRGENGGEGDAAPSRSATCLSAPLATGGDGAREGAVHGPQWVFLYKPSFFDLDAEEDLVEQFESGAECTHGSAILPAARVIGHPPDPKLLLLSEETTYLAPLLRTAAMSPPYMYAEAVEGFLMDFALPAVAAAKVDMVLRHDNHCRSTVRLVFVEDTSTWECAWVLYHYREDEDGERPLPGRYEDPDDPTQSIRVKADYTVDQPLPLGLWRRYVEMARDVEARAASATPAGEDKGGEPTTRVGEGSEETEGALDGLPFSLESRTLRFFGSMTAVALALLEIVAHQNREAES